MARCLRQTTDGMREIFSGQLAGLFRRLIEHHFGERGRAGHSRDAPFGFESNLSDPAIPELQTQADYVSTDGILQLDHCVRIGKVTCVARILKIIEQLRRVHLCRLYRRPVPSGK